MSKTEPADNPTVAKRIGQYVQLRDKLKEIDDAHEERRKPLVEAQNLITGWMMDFLEKTGSDSVKTKEGTCYASVRYSTSIADADLFMKHVIENNDFDLLDRRANATAVRAYVEDKGTLPPGVNMTALRTIGVRRASGK